MNCNSELKEIFEEETIEFSSINKLLKNHLQDIEPFEIQHLIDPTDSRKKEVSTILL